MTSSSLPQRGLLRPRFFLHGTAATLDAGHVFYSYEQKNFALGGVMKKVLCILTAMFAITWASGQTSSSSQTAGDQSSASTTKMAKSKKGMKKGAGEATIMGCLSGPNDEGAYVLTHGKRKIEVGGNDDLSKHVGHEVKLHGTWAKASDIGEKEASETSEKSEQGEAKEEQHERHFKVASIDHISDTCKAGGKMGAHKMNHKKMGGMEGGAAQPSPSPSPQN